MSSNDVNDIRPTSLRHFIGQRGVVEPLAVALDACFADGKRLDDVLLVGPAGLGKSQIASILGAELATKTHEALGQSIRCHSDLNALLLGARDREIVWVDEVHELQKVFQTALYLALDKRCVQVCGTKSIKSIPLADFTLVLGTTDSHSILAPLRDRVKLILTFSFYSNDELTQIVTYRAKALEWGIDETVAPMIAARSRGVPRLALRLLQACRRVTRSMGEQTITPGHFEKACLLDRIDPLGLGATEQQYLQMLADGGSRLNVIASTLGLPDRTIASVTEPFLIRAGLVAKDDQGRRQLTAQGHEHLRRVRNG